MRRWNFYRYGTLIGLFYVLIIYPPISQSLVHSGGHHGHHMHCQCGCEGDVSKCVCHVTSGLTGFSYCDTSLNLIFPFVPVLQLKQEMETMVQRPVVAHMPYSDEHLSLPLICKSIDHPPRTVIPTL